MIAQEIKSILEVGFDARRVNFYYRNKGKNIHCIDFIKTPNENSFKLDPSAKVQHGTILDIPYGDEKFESIFAFGLYHKLEDIEDLKKSSLKDIEHNYTAMF